MTPQSNSSSVPLSEEDMSKIKNKVLEVLRAKLVDHVDPRRFVTYLRAHCVLDQRECDEIKSACRSSRCEGAERFLDVLATKGSRGYDQFCNAIMKDKTQMFLLTALNKKLEVYKDHCRKQIAKDYEVWKKEQELQQKKQIHIVTQHKQHHPHPMASHAPQFNIPSHIYYPPNYRHDGLSVNQLPCRARSPVPLAAGSDSVITHDHRQLLQTHNGELVILPVEPNHFTPHQPWSQGCLNLQPPNLQTVSPQQDTLTGYNVMGPLQHVPVHAPLHNPSRDYPTGEGGQ